MSGVRGPSLVETKEVVYALTEAPPWRAVSS